MTVTVGNVGDIEDGGSLVVPAGGRAVAVFRVGDEYFALDDCCPHAGASLAGGEVSGGVVSCPWHGWRFRLGDGAWADNPRVKTRCYPVTVVGGEIRLTVPDPEGERGA